MQGDVNLDRGRKKGWNGPSHLSTAESSFSASKGGSTPYQTRTWTTERPLRGGISPPRLRRELLESPHHPFTTMPCATLARKVGGPQARSLPENPSCWWANMAHIRQSRIDSGLDQLKFLEKVKLVDPRWEAGNKNLRLPIIHTTICSLGRWLFQIGRCRENMAHIKQ